MAQRHASENVMPTVRQSQKHSACLFIASGVGFFVAAILGRQADFYGLGAAFIAIGGAFLPG